jgi:hypothetical protein
MDTSPPHSPGEEPHSGGGPEGEPQGAAYQALLSALQGEHRCLELCPICRAADLLRAGATPELREQWQALQREALLALKAAVELYLERLESDAAGPEPPRRGGPEARDIPIE